MQETPDNAPRRQPPREVSGAHFLLLRKKSSGGINFSIAHLFFSFAYLCRQYPRPAF